LKKFRRLSIYLLLINGFVLALLFACEDAYRNKSHASVSEQSIKEGRILAAKYCISCHALPDPAWLDSKSWEKGVLPAMGPLLGIFEHNFQDYPSSKNDQYLDKNFYPSQPLLNRSQWQNIIDYYSATSPDTLIRQQRQDKIEMELPLFAVQTPAGSYLNATTSFIKINPTGIAQSLVISDALKKRTYLFNKELLMTDSFLNDGPVVDIEFGQNGMLACNIGVLNPNNGKFGKGNFINKLANGKYEEKKLPMLDSLQRPVQLLSADFNRDGKMDYLICEFGFVTGALSWMEGTENNGFKRHVLRPLPGAIKAYTQDHNKDGAPDIWVLFGQGDEGIFLFTNKGDGNFIEEKLLSFPSVYGSSLFELIDFNKDGYADIIYTCGDNADYSPVLKPYHGVYLFMNDGSNHFEQKFFFAINGCYKALARDYDNDGDLDIATISFFADFKNEPEESFVYLKNTGSFKFKPYSLPESTIGRWLTMDAGDIDGDGDIDLVLGNFFIGPGILKSKIDWSKSPPFILLKNAIK
jgi:hypothetical protein